MRPLIFTCPCGAPGSASYICDDTWYCSSQHMHQFAGPINPMLDPRTGTVHLVSVRARGSP